MEIYHRRLSDDLHTMPAREFERLIVGLMCTDRSRLCMHFANLREGNDGR